jgi:hypothetical protein
MSQKVTLFDEITLTQPLAVVELAGGATVSSATENAGAAAVTVAPRLHPS